MLREPVNPAPAVSIDGRAVRSETLAAAAGAHVLVLSTAIGELGVQLHSSYTGHPDTQTEIGELLIEPREGAETTSRSAAAGELPVSHARERCLDDHLWSLRDKLEALGFEHVQIDVLERATPNLAI